MGIVIPKKTKPVNSFTNSEQLKGTPAKLAKLVQEHGTYKFEGFRWLQCQLDVVAEHLGVTSKTISRVIRKPPFRHRVRKDKEEPKFTLIRIGNELCESDYVDILRTIWAKGLLYFNAALAVNLTAKVMYLKSVDAPKALYERLVFRIASAEERAKDLEKLKAGEKVSLAVHPHEMGLLREVVKTLGEDAPGTVACLVTWEGWQKFTAYLKADDRATRHYHWPQLYEIANNPDIALTVYLDTLQESAKIDPSESNRLLAKIELLAPSKAA